MENQSTTVTSFVFFGFSFDFSVNIFSFLLFSFMYLLTLLGNTMIMVVTSHLTNPMYFFLAHLAFLDICFSSVTVPKLLLVFCTSQTISYSACVTQMFFVLLTGATEDCILAAMAYDRYAAICKPLHYILIMNKAFCRQLVGSAWTVSFLGALIITLPVLKLHFCGPNIIRDFSCELSSVIALACTETFTTWLTVFIIAGVIGGTSIIIILISYIHIISSILKLNSAEAKKKTFSTCSSHLIIVILYYTTACFSNMRPSSSSSVIVDLLFSIQYSIATPMLNPLIYSLKNREVREAIKKLMCYKPLISGTV